jgi:hypothetical protein
MRRLSATVVLPPGASTLPDPVLPLVVLLFVGFFLVRLLLVEVVVILPPPATPRNAFNGSIQDGL